MIGPLPLRHMLTAVLGLMLVAAATGCRSSRVEMPATASLHPEHETRMSSHPMPGYVPTPVWRVQSGKSNLYLVGTVHLVPPSQRPFPSSLYAAYEEADEVYLELGEKDPGGFFGSLRVAWWFMKNHRDFACSKGKTIADYVSPETDQILRAASGREYCRFSRLSPVGWIVALSTVGPLFQAAEVPVQGNSIRSHAAASSSEGGSGAGVGDYSAARPASASEGDGMGGVDDYFMARAVRDRKPIRGLDDTSVYQAMFQMLDAMLADAKQTIAAKGADAALQGMLQPSADASAAEDAPDDLVSWRTGDLASEERELAELRKELEATPGLYDKLLPERNRAWIKQIKPLLRGSKKTVVMVGFAHFPGEDGLLQLLRDAGYEPVQMYGVDLRNPGGSVESGSSGDASGGIHVNPNAALLAMGTLLQQQGGAAELVAKPWMRGAGPADTSTWVGANYTPAYASNQIQMWHDFRPDVIEKELAAARRIFGFTSLRVFLHHMVYDAEKEILLQRIEQFLQICDRHNLKPGFVFFDDCHRRKGATLAPQPPIKGYCNGRWAALHDVDRKEENFPKFKNFVQDIVRAHNQDPRVLWWEVYNDHVAAMECKVMPGEWNQLRVAVDGSRIRAWLNRMHPTADPANGLRIDFADKENPVLSGNVGLRAVNGEAWFDNVVVMPASDLK